MNKSGIALKFSNLIMEETTKVFPVVPKILPRSSTMHKTITTGWSSVWFSVGVVGLIARLSEVELIKNDAFSIVGGDFNQLPWEKKKKTWSSVINK